MLVSFFVLIVVTSNSCVLCNIPSMLVCFFVLIVGTSNSCVLCNISSMLVCFCQGLCMKVIHVYVYSCESGRSLAVCVYADWLPAYVNVLLDCGRAETGVSCWDVIFLHYRHLQ